MDIVKQSDREVADIEKQLLNLQGQKQDNLLSPLREKLREIDSRRVDGKFIDKDGSIPPGQAELVARIEKCYILIGNIEFGIDELENELTSIRDELTKLHKKSNVTTQEFDPIRKRLEAIEHRRLQGKFRDSTYGIPPGQDNYNDLWIQCNEMRQTILNQIPSPSEEQQGFRPNLQT